MSRNGAIDVYWSMMVNAIALIFCRGSLIDSNFLDFCG